MAKHNVNRHNLLCVKLLELRRHLNTCKECRAAIGSRDYSQLCPITQLAIIEVAIKWDANIAGRLAARNSKQEYIFPCPEPNAHGGAYALTAEAVIVSGHQDGIW